MRNNTNTYSTLTEGPKYAGIYTNFPEQMLGHNLRVTEWQAAVLLDFQERVDSGEDAAGLSWQETAETGGGAEYRFMKAIPTGALCLACHGKVLAPEVAAQIESLYPEDKATGFSEGDLRGAFVVTKSMGSE